LYADAEEDENEPAAVKGDRGIIWQGKLRRRRILYENILLEI
jgi:hypothetical protein